MRKTTKVTGTKIAQAAKDLNVTSVTIRRYISEFNIDTATDENGIKVLPPKAMEELQAIRKLKEDGLTNPKVLEELETSRSKGGSKSKAEDKDDEEKEPVKPTRAEATRIVDAKVRKVRGRAVAEEEEQEAEEEEEDPAAKRGVVKRRGKAEPVEKQAEVSDDDEETSEEEEAREGDQGGDAAADGRPKHALTCQTCGKSFEHMNPRLRDCLDCYRAKRKERRRGGDRHKNVIQHPLAQQVASKMANQSSTRESAASAAESAPAETAPAAQAPSRRESYAPSRTAAPSRQREERPAQLQAHSAVSAAQPVIGGLKTKVRSYRKAIEETRGITGSLKRRLERPDLPEGERRWLEQIYAYQLILHQGWRHLSEYKSATVQQSKLDDK